MVGSSGKRKHSRSLAAWSPTKTVLVSSIGVVEVFRETQILQAATFNFTPYLATALLFVLITIPLARLTDWMIARERAKRQTGTAL